MATMTKVKTIDLKGKDYAQVKDRIKQFRSENPRGLIETNPIVQEGKVIFKARILKDKSDPNTAEATGHALQTSKAGDSKEFEKLETIAVGRALALLGYSADGEIASSEEMEEFQEYQKNQQEEAMAAYEEKMRTVSNLVELQSVWSSLPPEAKAKFKDLKDEIKKKYAN